MYKFFAKYYDKLMWDRSNYVLFINNVIKEYNLNPINILDIACWTWKVLSALNDKYNKYWIDLSENMLDIAKKNVKEGIFYRQDMRELYFNDIKFDLITNLFDSINHVIDFSDWEKIFKSSFELLNNNGVFLFDINTKSKLDKVSKYKPVMYEVDNDIIFFTTKNIDDWVVEWHIKFFENRKSNNYQLFQENIKEKSFDLDKIQKSLDIFSKVILVDEHFNKATEDSDRVFFICIK